MKKMQKLLSLTTLLIIGTGAWAQSDINTNASDTIQQRTSTRRKAIDTSTIPKVGGNVFGGGRMADVQNATAVTTATINIYASKITGGVFGGNDIKGSVAQATGDANASAKIIIHDSCDKNGQVGEVYGGGNGYYYYEIVDSKVNVYARDENGQKTGDVLATFDKTSDDVTSYYPTLTNTSVIIGEETGAKNNVALAEVYGGAKNAYVTGTSNVTVNSGTIGKVFAGNNYGGSVNSTTLVINSTSVPSGDAPEFANIDWTKVGDYENTGGFGIGEAYGGGNAVNVETGAGLTINGGYIKTIFGGNNLADMTGIPTISFGTTNNIYVNTVYGGGNAGDMKGAKAMLTDCSKFLNSALFSSPYTVDKVPIFVGTDVQVNSNTLSVNNVYGGCKSANVDNSTLVHVNVAGTGGYIGTVYGGCDIAGSVGYNPGKYETGQTVTFTKYDHSGTDDIAFQGDMTNTSADVILTAGTVENIFGGGNGAEYAAYKKEKEDASETYRDEPWVVSTTVGLFGGTVTGNIYGGGNMATVGHVLTEDKNYYSVSGISFTNGQTLKMNSYILMGNADGATSGLTVNGKVYGGGRMANVLGTMDIYVKDGVKVNELYAGNDIAGRVEGDNRGTMLGGYTSVGTTLREEGDATGASSTVSFKGDALTSSNAQVYVRIEDGANINTLFGGGNGYYTYGTYDSATNTTPIYTYGTTDFASATPVATYSGDATLDANKPTQTSTWLDIKGTIGTSYGGGNNADIETSNTYITNGATVGTAFAGGNAATVTKEANLWLDCSAARGTQEYVDGSDATKIPNVGTIFGGNNIADMAIVPCVKLWSGSVKTVYGGGNQGDMVGYEAGAADLSQYIDADAFQNLNAHMHSKLGVSSDINVTPQNLVFFYSTQVVVDQEAAADATIPLAVGTVYGGCKAANVDLSSYVLLRSASYIGDVYGGCDIAGKVGKSGNKTITAAADVYGYDPTYPQDPNHKYLFTLPAGFPIVNTASYVRLWGGTVSGNIYGGGNGAYDYTEADGTLKAYPTGAEKNDANLLATVATSKATYPSVFATGVSVEGGTAAKNIYGGGNKADVGDNGTWHGTNYMLIGKTDVGVAPATNTYGPVINGTVYAGCKMADMYGIQDVIVKSGCVIDSLFAGNDISGQVKGEGRSVSTLGSTFPEGWSTALYGGHNSYNETSLANFDGNNNSIQVYVRVEGQNGDVPAAQITTLFGGGNGDYDYTTATSPYYGLSKPTQSSCWLDIKGNVDTSYGGGNAADVAVSNTYITNGATVGTAFGGGNNATVTSSANITVNCNAAGDDWLSKLNVTTVFGGNNIAAMNIVPTVSLVSGAVGTVYGGGNAGDMTAYAPTVLNVKGFISDDVFNASVKSAGFSSENYPTFLSTRVLIDAPSTGLRVKTVYGGCKAANVNHASYVHISNADYMGDVYGGCDVAGSVGAAANVTLASAVTFTDYNGDATTLAFPAGASTCNPAAFVNIAAKSGVQISGNVFGSGNGAYIYDGTGTATCTAYAINADGTQGDAVATFDNTVKDIPWVLCSAVALEGGELLQNVYGGGNKAEVGKSGTSAKGMTYMFLGKTDGSTLIPKVTGSVYAGGRMADVLGSVDVIVKDGMEINRLFAGNDIAGSIEGNNRGSFSAAVYGTGTTTALYGGGNAYNGTSLTTGLNNHSSDVYVRVENGAKITTLFGGGNGDYTYSDPASGVVTISDNGTFLGTVTAATAAAAKPKQVTTWLDVMGQVGTVYGGGNAADIDYTNVCIVGAGQVGTSEVNGAVYGGCKSANVTYITNVMMDSYTDASSVTTTPKVYGNVFGGCDISGNVGDCSLACDGTDAHLATDLSNESTVGHTHVKIMAGEVTGRVFGGGNGLQDAAGAAYYTGTLAADSYVYPDGTYSGKQLPACQNSYVEIDNATIGTTAGSNTHTVFGGGQGAGTQVMHNVISEIGSTTHNTLINGILYGGSYSGFVNSTCNDVTKTDILGYGSNTQVKGDIYGGSFGNFVRGEIQLNINNIQIGENESPAGIFAGNNAAAQPLCKATINYVGNDCNVTLFGGGNMADFYGTTRITMTTGKVGYVFGGGNNADVYGNTIVEILGGEVCHSVYGGGKNGSVYPYNAANDPAKNNYANGYGGNTTVIVRDDCLQVDGEGNFVTDSFSGNRQANRGTGESYYNVYDAATNTLTQTNDPCTAANQMYTLVPNDATNPIRSEIKIGGNVFGGGLNGTVSGNTNVQIGAK